MNIDKLYSNIKRSSKMRVFYRNFIMSICALISCGAQIQAQTTDIELAGWSFSDFNEDGIAVNVEYPAECHADGITATFKSATKAEKYDDGSQISTNPCTSSGNNNAIQQTVNKSGSITSTFTFNTTGYKNIRIYYDVMRVVNNISQQYRVVQGDITKSGSSSFTNNVYRTQTINLSDYTDFDNKETITLNLVTKNSNTTTNYNLYIDNIHIVGDKIIAPLCVENPNPSNGTTINTSSFISNGIAYEDAATLQWDPVLSNNDNDAAEGYKLYFGTNSGQLDSIATIYTNSYIISNLINGKKYYWKVIPFNYAGNAIECSEYNFTANTNSLPECVEKISPENGIIGELTSITNGNYVNENAFWLKWRKNEDAISYKIKFGTDPNNLTFSIVTSDTTFLASNLTHGTKYYWTVLPINSVGTATCNDIYENIAAAKPTCATIKYPENGTCINTTNVKLTWDESKYATSYTVLYGTNPNSLSLKAENITSNFVELSLEDGNTYYWQIIPKNEYLTNNDCEINSFTIKNSIEITNGNAIVTCGNEFDFTASDETQNYTYTFSSNEGKFIKASFSDECNINAKRLIIYDGDNTTAQIIKSYTSDEIKNQTITSTGNSLTFKVEGEDTESYTWNSKIECLNPDSKPACANIVSPISGSDVLIATIDETKLAARLRWNKTSNATSYTLKYGNNASNLTNVITGINDTTYVIGSLTAGNWFWQIVPENSVGSADGCQIQSFKAIFSSVSDYNIASSTQGKEFYFSLMQNGYYNNQNNNKYNAIVCAKTTAQVTFYYYETNTSETVVVKGGETLIKSIAEDLVYTYKSDSIQNRVVKVTSSEDISLYVANEAYKSFDASIVLPTEALGTDYIVQTYPNGKSQYTPKFAFGPCFIVIATEDETEISITPSCRTASTIDKSGNDNLVLTWEKGSKHTIKLNKGQCYFVRALTPDNDLSGTIVTTSDCKTIAIFNGNILAGVPTYLTDYYDHIFEQAYPVSNWGTQFAVTSSIGYKDGVRDDNDDVEPVHIMASKDNTTITINGTIVTTINTNEVYEYLLKRSLKSSYIETSEPCAVYQYQRSANYALTSDDNIGDPSMYWVSPIDRSISDLTFSTYNATGITNNNHFINVVVPQNGVSGMRLISRTTVTDISNEFSPITGNSSLYFARINLNHGTYTLKNYNEIGFIATVYGLGNVRGYAYTAGSGSIPLKDEFSVGNSTNENSSINNICLNQPIRFSINQNSTSEINLVEWDFGDGSENEIGNPIYHVYTEYNDSIMVNAYIYTTIKDECTGNSMTAIDTTKYVVYPSVGTTDTVYHTMCQGEIFNDYRTINGIYQKVFEYTGINSIDTTIVGEFSNGGCECEITYIIKVNKEITPSLIEKEIVECTGLQTPKLVCNNTNGEDSDLYIWQISSDKNEFNDINNASSNEFYPEEIGFYRKAFTNECKTTYSDTIEITSSDINNIIQMGTASEITPDIENCSNEDSITCGSVNLPENTSYEFLWQYTTTPTNENSWINASGDNNGIAYSINGLTFSDKTYFRRNLIITGCNTFIGTNYIAIQGKNNILSIKDTIITISCNGTSKASVTLNINGSGNYSFLKNNETVIPSNINGSEYTFDQLGNTSDIEFKIIDKESGCDITYIATEEELTYVPLSSTLSTNETSYCPGDTTSVLLTINGGAAPYNILWCKSTPLNILSEEWITSDNNSDSKKITIPSNVTGEQLAYNVSIHIKDNKGCGYQKNQDIVVVNSTPTTPTYDVKAQENCGSKDGKITIKTPIGDNVIYSIDNFTTEQTDTIFSDLSVGNYTIGIKNKSYEGLCPIFKEITVENGTISNKDIEFSYINGESVCPLTDSLEIEAILTGDWTENVTYEWIGAESKDNNEKALFNGSSCNEEIAISVKVTDENQCFVEKTITLVSKNDVAPSYTGSVRSSWQDTTILGCNTDDAIMLNNISDLESLGVTFTNGLCNVNNLILNVTDGPTSENQISGYSFVRYYKVENGCGKYKTITQNIKVKDSQKPIVTNIPDTTISFETTVIPDLSNYVLKYTSDNCSNLTATQTPLAGSEMTADSVNVSVTIADNSNNDTTINVSVLRNLPTLTINKEFAYGCSNEIIDTIFAISDIQSSSFKYQWYKTDSLNENIDKINNATDNFFIPSEIGEYYIFCKETTKGINSNIIPVMIVEKPNAPTNISSPFACKGESALFEVSLNTENENIICSWMHEDGTIIENANGTRYDTLISGSLSLNAIATDISTGCSSDFTTVTITEKDLPILEFTATNNTYCEGSNATITITKQENCIYKYGLNSQTDNVFTEVPEGNHSIIIEDTITGCVNYKIHTIEKSITYPNLTIANTTVIACGENSEVTLNAETSDINTIIRWYDSSNQLLANIGSEIDVIIANSTNYYAEAYDTITKCTTKEEIQVELKQMPEKPTATVINNPNCSGTVEASIYVNEQTGCKYAVSKTDIVPTYFSTNLIYENLDTVNYAVWAINEYNCKDSSIYAVKNEFTYPTITPTGDSICGEGSITLTAVSDNNGSVYWYENEADADDDYIEINSTYTTPVLTESRLYYAEAVIENTQCKSLERIPISAVIKKLPTIPNIESISIEDNTTCKETKNGSITITTEDDNYTYSIDGGNTYDDSKSFNNLEANDYYISIKGENGCTSLTDKITIADLSSAPSIIQTIGDTICEEGNITLSATTSIPSAIVVWYNSNGDSLGTGNNYSQEIDATTQFFAQAIDTISTCASAKKPVIATAEKTPSIRLTGSNSQYVKKGDAISTIVYKSDKSLAYFGSIPGINPISNVIKDSFQVIISGVPTTTGNYEYIITTVDEISKCDPDTAKCKIIVYESKDSVITINSGDSLNYTPKINIGENNLDATYTWTSDNGNGSGSSISEILYNTTNAPITVAYIITPNYQGTEFGDNYLYVTVNPIAQVNAINKQVISNGKNSRSISFSTNNTGGTTTYTWENTKTDIGCGTECSTNCNQIATFTVTNNGTEPDTARIVVTPTFCNNEVCNTGDPTTFEIIALPTVHMADTIADILISENTFTSEIPLSTDIKGDSVYFTWAKIPTNNEIDLSISCTDSECSIQPFLATTEKAKTQKDIVTIVVTPNICFDGNCNSGVSDTFNVTIIPTAQIIEIPSVVYANGDTTDPIAINIDNETIGDRTYFTMENISDEIGFPNCTTECEGLIPSFIATNNDNDIKEALIKITPYTCYGENCIAGEAKNVKITVLPSLSLEPISDITITSGQTVPSISLQGSSINNVQLSYTWTIDKSDFGISSCSNKCGSKINGSVANNTSINPDTATVVVKLNGGITFPDEYGDSIFYLGQATDTFSIVVLPKAKVSVPERIIAVNNSSMDPIALTTTVECDSFYFSWTAENEDLGLLKGTGKFIPSFTAANEDVEPDSTKITITPFTCYGDTCITGESKTITLVVLPSISLEPNADRTINNGDKVEKIIIVSNISNTETSYSWKNIGNEIGFTNADEFSLLPFIPGFTAKASGIKIDTAQIVITGKVCFSDYDTCLIATDTLNIYVLPTIKTDGIDDIYTIDGATINAITLNTNISGDSTLYSWKTIKGDTIIFECNDCSNTIPSVQVTNIGNKPITSTVVVTPSVYVNNVTATAISDTFNIIVYPQVKIDHIDNILTANDSIVNDITFNTNITGDSTYFSWENIGDNIGIENNDYSKNGIIPSFTAINNNTNKIDTATIVITPNVCFDGKCLAGDPDTLSIVVIPTITIDPIKDMVVSSEIETSPISIATNVNGDLTKFTWENIGNENIGFNDSITSEYHIPSFTPINDSDIAITTTIVVTPQICFGETCITGINDTFNITVIPNGSIVPIADLYLLSGDTTGAINIKGNFKENTYFTWNNVSTESAIEFTNCDSKDCGTQIASFKVDNNSSEPDTATIVVVPYTCIDEDCIAGTSDTFNIIVFPSVTIEPISDMIIINDSMSTPTSITYASTASEDHLFFSWKTDNAKNIGLEDCEECSNNIPSFKANTESLVPDTANVIVTAYVKFGDTSLEGAKDTFSIIVLPSMTIDPIANIIIANDSIVPPISIKINLNGDSTYYAWKNIGDEIGLTDSIFSRLSVIPSFTAINTGDTPAVGKIAVTAHAWFGDTCIAGKPDTFDIIVLPTVRITNLTDIETGSGNTIDEMTINTNITGDKNYFTWIISGDSVGFPNCSGDCSNIIPSFITENNGIKTDTSTITITPYVCFYDTCINGESKTIDVIVHPTVNVENIADIVTIAGKSVDEIWIQANASGDSTYFTWENVGDDNGFIDCLNTTDSKCGNIISSFIAENNSNEPTTGIIKITTYVCIQGNCQPEDPDTFNITVLPNINVVPAISDMVVSNGKSTKEVQVSTNNIGESSYITWRNIGDNIGDFEKCSTKDCGNIINSFTVVNNTDQIDTAVIVVTPYVCFNDTCLAGTNDTFNIYSLPTITIDPIADMSISSGNETDSIEIITNISNEYMIYTWTNIGGSLNNFTECNNCEENKIPSFIAENETDVPYTTQIEVSAKMCIDGKCGESTTDTFDVTILPSIHINTINDTILLNNTQSNPITLSTNFQGDSTYFTWENIGSNIGIEDCDNCGNVIPAFTAQNTELEDADTATIVVNAYTCIDGNCVQSATDTFTITVYPSVRIVPIADIVTANDSTTDAITINTYITGSTTRFTWKNIGDEISSDGTETCPGSCGKTIQSFTAINTTDSVLIGRIVVKPEIKINNVWEEGITDTFLITVLPSVIVNESEIAGIQYKGDTIYYNDGDTINSIKVNTNTQGDSVSYKWENIGDDINFDFSMVQTDSIAEITAINTSSAPITAKIVITPTVCFDGYCIEGNSDTMFITILPTVRITPSIADMRVFNDSMTTAVTINTNITGDDLKFTWKNIGADINFTECPGSCGKTIQAFTATNNGNTPDTARIVVTPQIFFGNEGSYGVADTFDIIVYPSIVITEPIADITIADDSTASPTLVKTNIEGDNYYFTYEVKDTKLVTINDYDDAKYIPSLIVNNTDTLPHTTEIIVTPHLCYDTLCMTGEPDTFTVNVLGRIIPNIYISNINLSQENYCIGDQIALYPELKEGVPTKYRFTFDNTAKNKGFHEEEGYFTNDEAITFDIPEGVPGGTYIGYLQLWNEERSSKLYEFKFTVNYGSDYIRKLWSDVVVCDNSNEIFETYQWYHNGEIIEGATNQYYCDYDGLNGNYSLIVTTINNESLIICNQYFEKEEAPFSISATPNPVKVDENINVVIEGLNSDDFSDARLYLYASDGTLMYQNNSVSTNNSITISQSGEYIAIVVANRKSENRKSASCKILVQP